jgi:multisubunit Na+/H+ antiporter MnhE subunit
MGRSLRFVTLFVLLAVFWQILSARVDPLFIVLGVLSCGVAAWFGVILLEGVIAAPRNSARTPVNPVDEVNLRDGTSPTTAHASSPDAAGQPDHVARDRDDPDQAFPSPTTTSDESAPIARPRISIPQLVGYTLWLLSRIPPAGIAIARVVLDPRRPPRPGVVRFRTQLESPVARSLLANSITLVPGTMTLNVVDDEFVVHAFTPDAVADLANAATQRRIARVFRVPPDEPPTMRWDDAHDELPEEPA